MTNYRQPVSITWWARRRSYALFILRELSSVFVAWFVVFLLLFAHAAGRSRADYERFLDWASNPLVVVLNVLTLGFVALHTVTWLAAAPRAMSVRLRGKRVPPHEILAGHYLALTVVSVIVAAVVLW